MVALGRSGRVFRAVCVRAVVASTATAARDWVDTIIFWPRIGFCAAEEGTLVREQLHGSGVREGAVGDGSGVSGPARYETGKGCLTLGLMILVLTGLMVAAVVLVGVQPGVT